MRIASLQALLRGSVRRTTHTNLLSTPKFTSSMVGSPNVNLIHHLAGSEQELPLGKRPKLLSDNTSGIANDDITNKLTRRDKRTNKKKRGLQLPEPCSPDDVLWQDVIAVLGKDTVEASLGDDSGLNSPLEFHQEIELDILNICSHGEGIALVPETVSSRPWAVIVPFSLPGEHIKARIYRNARLHSFADLLQVITSNPALRDESRIKCKYFGSCAGCQYQMLSYEIQLDWKRDVIAKAYRNFSDLPESSVPPIPGTIGSPLQYGYRTKITPHFSPPPKSARKKPPPSNSELERPKWLNIGFNKVGTRKTVDIEECPIATTVVNEGYLTARSNIIKNIYTYKKDVSLLYRDSLEEQTATPHHQNVKSVTDDQVPDIEDLSSSFEKHVCISNHNGTVLERVGPWLFQYKAGSFFQNNNSVLVPLTSYVKDAIFPPSSTSSSPPPTHLVDAYCGAGLFSITLSPYFTNIAGIESSLPSITSARQNASLNARYLASLSSSDPDNSAASPPKITFRVGDAADIFASVRDDFPPAQTAMVIDPPRKGCDERFVRQLVGWRPSVVVYVSCNVHTQARDVGMILKMSAEDDGENGEKKGRYVLESLRGFDLFPQTAHVESVAVLRLA